MPRQPYASPVMNIRIIFFCHHFLFVGFITVGANRIRPINVFVANRIRPIFHWEMDTIFALKNRYKRNLPLLLHLISAPFCSVSQSRVPTLLQR